MAEPEPADAAVALDGRALGRRGAQTRQRLLDATARLLEDNGLRELRVVDIARAVDLAPATFYQYFRDVEEAVLALAEEVGEQATPLGELLERPWTGPTGPCSTGGMSSTTAVMRMHMGSMCCGVMRCCCCA